jgi:hypothetical protein
VPAAHWMHDATDVAPVSEEYVPCGHWVHVDKEVAPVPKAYVPAWHCHTKHNLVQKIC